ncbi:cation:proton antiporter [Chitinophagaceae bacterium LB-8]|uniref:Cation:proton antiporter n=1 Tax=Paraflavisolibacter caeni TaxID=2982496 RepID=A0A9X2XVU1_9BACT|nr:cation:proton antiporter [Paraflavisolibacter caeni]MCU7550309.1 cation:proton antiporter [Paraflavisolibacter caeni]
MNHLPPLITDLALILGAAAAITLLFRKLKQPLVLGYIIAGILVSPNFTLFPTILEVHNVQVWAEIGVIFLLFSLGLEFSFKKLVHVGGSSSVAATAEAVGMSVIGYATGQLLGWSFMDSIFLGALLAISSTTIIIKAIDELNLKKKKFATLVFGILIVEDIIAIAILVLLSTFTTTKQVVSIDTFISILKLAFFLILWFITGIFFIPSLLKKASNILNDEILLIVSIAMCLLMVFLTTQAGFSPALGAFVMGSLLAETTKAETIEHLVRPVKDLFGAIFFVSVGMLINLGMMAEYIGPILLITGVCILGKILTTGFGAFISGNTLKVSIQTGMSLAQIGEFSFIIAALGNSLKVTSEFLYPTIVAVSGITTFTTPYLIRASTPLFNWIEKNLPERLKTSLAKYSSEAVTLTSVSDWQKVIKEFLINLILFSVIIIAIIYLSAYYVLPWVGIYLDDSFGPVAASALTLLLMAPFLWGLTVRNEQTDSFARIFAQQKYKGPIWLMRGIKLSLALFFIIFLLSRFFSFAIALYAAVLMATLFSILRKKIQTLYDALEKRFISNLNDKELQEELKAMELQAGKRNAALAPWDAHLTTFDILPESAVIGKTLGELRWREQIGINIAMIKRGRLTITIPKKDDCIFPGDKLYIICTDVQEKKMNAILRPDKKLLESQKDIQVELEKFTIMHDSPFVNKTISESGIRKNATALVVGIERNGKRILNPESTTVLEVGDLVWIVEEKS